jgi:hypothetical protein
MAKMDLARCPVHSNAKHELFHGPQRQIGRGAPSPLKLWGMERGAGRDLWTCSSFMGTRNSPVRYFHTKLWETDMLKGGLLWLIGIPLPIILLLFFFGWLS